MVSPRGPMKRMAISPSESSHYSSASTRSPQGSNMQYVGEKCRMRLNYLKSVRLSEANTVKMLAILKGLAQCHVVLGLIMLILSTIADYTSGRINTIRLYGLEECCSFYFIVTGLVGMCGAASYRRGLVITFLVMSIHAIIIFVPTVIIVSSFDIHFFQHECWGECDWHLLAPRLPTDSRCQILCGEHVDDNMRMTMTRLGTDYRLDAGLITAAIIELGLAIASTVICTKTICGSGKENTFCPQKCSPKGAWPMPPYRPGRLGVASVGHKGSSNYGNGAIESCGSIRLCHRRSLKRDPPPPRPLLSSPPFDTGHYTSENNS